MLCSSCGFDNPGNPRFCAGCGVAFAAGARAGAPVSYNAPGGGGWADAGSAGRQYSFPPAADKSLLAVYIIIPVVGLIVGALVAVFQFLVF